MISTRLAWHKFDIISIIQNHYEVKDVLAITPLENSLTSARVAQAIRQAIVTGQLRPGSKIAQDLLADQLGVSRMPIREALVQLAAEGLVTSEPRRGAWVAPLSLETIEESYALRSWLEPKAVRLSVPRLTDEDLHALRQHLAALEIAESGNDGDRFVEANRQFHQILRSRCPWAKLQGFVDMLWNGFPPLTPQFVTQQMVQDRAEHQQLLQAAEARDGDRAAVTMTAHITRSGDRAREHFKGLGWTSSPLEPVIPEHEDER